MIVTVDCDQLLTRLFKGPFGEHTTVSLPGHTVLLEAFRYCVFPYPKGHRASKTHGGPTRYEMIQCRVVKRLKMVLRLIDVDPSESGTAGACRRALFRVDFDKTDRGRCPYIGWTGPWQPLYGLGLRPAEQLDIDDVAETWYASGFMVRRKIENVRAYEAYRILGS